MSKHRHQSLTLPDASNPCSSCFLCRRLYLEAWILTVMAIIFCYKSTEQKTDNISIILVRVQYLLETLYEAVVPLGGNACSGAGHHTLVYCAAIRYQIFKYLDTFLAVGRQLVTWGTCASAVWKYIKWLCVRISNHFRLNTGAMSVYVGSIGTVIQESRWHW